MYQGCQPLKKLATLARWLLTGWLHTPKSMFSNKADSCKLDWVLITAPVHLIQPRPKPLPALIKNHPSFFNYFT